jgi:hypothetical protein
VAMKAMQSACLFGALWVNLQSIELSKYDHGPSRKCYASHENHWSIEKPLIIKYLVSMG